MTRTTKQQATQHAYVYYFLEIIQMKRSRDSQSFVAKLRSGPVAMCFHKKKDCCPTMLCTTTEYSHRIPSRLLLSVLPVCVITKQIGSSFRAENRTSWIT